MNREELFFKLDNLNTYKNQGPAPHKPLLILYALGKLKEFRTRYIPFSLVQEDLLHLLTVVRDEGNHQPRYPFWNLQRDGIWEVLNREIFIEQADGSPTKNELIKKGAIGGFAEEVYVALCFDDDLINQVAKFVSDKYFSDLDLSLSFPQLSF